MAQREGDAPKGQFWLRHLKEFPPVTDPGFNRMGDFIVIRQAVGQHLERIDRLDRQWHVADGWDVTTAGLTPGTVVLTGRGGVVLVRAAQFTGSRVELYRSHLSVDGIPNVHVSRAREDAVAVWDRLSDHLDFEIPVTAVLVLGGARRTVLRAVPEGVTVLLDPQLAPWLHSLPPRLTLRQAESLRATAGDPRIWAPSQVFATVA